MLIQASLRPSIPTRVSCKVELYAFASAETLWGPSEPALAKSKGPVQAEQGWAGSASQLARTTEVTVVKRTTVARSSATLTLVSWLRQAPKWSGDS
jgi:hypothetical protein